jgi:5'-nucleotidase
MTRRSFVLPVLLTCLLLGFTAAPQPPPYRILVTNDDGVRAPGVLALADALKALGEVVVVAPGENQSGKGHALTINDPIYVDAVALPGGLSGFAVEATPATCVKVGIKAILPARPDLVVSGINRGANVGMVAYVSGTVGAAREAALAGIPAIASSLASSPQMDYGPAAQITLRIAETVKARGLDAGVFLNVNVPPGAADAIRGLRVTTQSPLQGTERFEERRTPSGRRYFWSVWEEPAGDPEVTDVGALERGYAAVTPLRAGEFDRKTFDALRGAWAPR